MRTLSEQWITLSEAAGHRRYLLGGLAITALTIVDWISGYSYMSWLLGIPSWAVVTIVALAALVVWLLRYATTLRQARAPKIALTYEDNAAFRKSVILKEKSANAVVQWEAISIRGLANALGDFPINNCTPWVTKIEFKRKRGRGFTAVAPHERIKLQWALERNGFHPTTLAAGVPTYFGILRAEKLSDSFSVPTEVKSFSHPPRFKDHGVYRITVAATGDASTTATMRLLVTWNGQWDQIRAELDGTRQTSQP